MKKILLFLIMVCSATLYAQTDSTHLNIKASLNEQEIYKDVKGALVEVGKALKVGSEHVYYVLVKQQLVTSIVNIIIYIALTAGVWFCWSVFYREYKDLVEKDRYYDGVFSSSLTGIPFIIGLLLTIILIVCAITGVSETVTGFVNPEYGALKDIMKMIHPAPVSHGN